MRAGCLLGWRNAHEPGDHQPVAVAAAKDSIHESWDSQIDEALANERRQYERALLSEDRLEGLKAFAEKRAPRWQGR